MVTATGDFHPRGRSNVREGPCASQASAPASWTPIQRGSNLRARDYSLGGAAIATWSRFGRFCCITRGEFFYCSSSCRFRVVAFGPWFRAWLASSAKLAAATMSRPRLFRWGNKKSARATTERGGIARHTWNRPPNHNATWPSSFTDQQSVSDILAHP
jgi:hypothetical protein